MIKIKLRNISMIIDQSVSVKGNQTMNQAICDELSQFDHIQGLFNVIKILI
jgi:hypothetical protein